MTEQVTSKQEIYKALRDYASMGLPIIPLCTHDHRMETTKHKERCACAGKIPRVRDWEQMSSTTNAQIKSWIQEFEEFNLGLVLGDNSGYVGVDVDGFGGEDMLEELSNGDLPETWSYRTGDGFRLLYSVPSHLKTKKFVNQDKSQKHTECSILAAGQQTVVPPSMHHTGYRYEWDEGHSPWDIDCAPAPKWLLDLVVVDEKGQTKAGTIDLTSDNPTYVAPEEDKVPEGMVEANPLVITDNSLDTFFMEPEGEFDYRVPFNAPEGRNKSKSKQDEIPIMDQYFSEGGRDNGMMKVIGHLCAKHRDLGKDMIIVMAQHHNNMRCTPPLKADDIAAKVQHIWELEEVKTAEHSKKRKDEDKDIFDALKVAQITMNLMEEKGMLLRREPSTGVLWKTYKSEGPWVPVDLKMRPNMLEVEIAVPMLQEKYGGKSMWDNSRNFANVTQSIARQLMELGKEWTVSDSETDTQSATKHKYIPLAGGKLLDWRTGELKPWDPSTFLTYVIPIEYDPSAKYTNWTKRLTQWIPEQQARDVLQEFIGYSLIPYMGFEKALLFQGEGANGKSIFIETIMKVFGRDITEAATMKHLFSQFGKEALIGKILNSVSEAGADYLQGANADDFKNMVSGGPVMADIKGKTAIRFNNTAKFIFSANHDIKTSDKSEGWLRRLIIVPFDQNFQDSGETKTDIMDELELEKSGILNWAIEGLRRLMANGKFTQSEVINKRMEAYKASNNLPEAFFQECLRVTPPLTVNGKVVTMGIPVALIRKFFHLWLQVRDKLVKNYKVNDHIKDYLLKRGVTDKKLESKNQRHASGGKTNCWVNLDFNVNDSDFIEMALDDEAPWIVPNDLRIYLKKRLEELNNAPNPPEPVGDTSVEYDEAK